MTDAQITCTSDGETITHSEIDVYFRVERTGDNIWVNMYDDSGDRMQVFTENEIRVLKEICEFILVTYTENKGLQS